MVKGGFWILVLSITVGPAAGCAREPAAPPVRVAIVEPEDGALVPGPDVEVALNASGVAIAPAASREPGTAHHHLFLDLDVTSAGEKIPAGRTGIIHLGKGDSAFTFRDVAAGSHRIIAVLADSAHIPLTPLAVDTVHVTVSGSL